jgi:hypothetical protein
VEGECLVESLRVQAVDERRRAHRFIEQPLLRRLREQQQQQQ